ncbi:MAG: stage 0 sporulation family protein [Leptolinea sp.]|jgi:cell fate regulator YaaT (PSP1 superfamily)|nr:stage 0 sporulation family protein [Leptolinea sp.]
MPQLIVGVRFNPIGKIYHFDSGKITDLTLGDYVVVETSRGKQLGQVSQIISDPGNPPEGGWKLIERRATPRDLVTRQSWQSKEPEVVDFTRQRSKELRLNGVKIISSEYSFDGNRLTVFFSTETEEKADLKSLRQDVQRRFAPVQVDLRQIGPRDVSKSICGIGACGLEKRCCCQFLSEFSSISIRMAKEQGISLTPGEITGMCGRLRCCLAYEFEQYSEARSHLPKRNKEVVTPAGTGKVIDIRPLQEMVTVDIPEIGVREFHASEITFTSQTEEKSGAKRN